MTDNILRQIQDEVAALTDEEIRAAVKKILSRKRPSFDARAYCPQCDAELTTASAEADACTQCKNELDLTYVISEDEYMGSGMTMTEFVGTWRELLERVTGSDDAETREELLDEEEPDGRRVKDLTDEELKQIFDDANGDGQPYVMVYCVEQHRKVLG